MLKSEQKGRISALYKSRPARASNSPLERHSQIPARASNPPLERRMHATRTFTDMMPVRASNSPLKRQTHTPARASNPLLERIPLQTKYWMGDFPARAPTPPLERTSNNRVPLERQKRRSSGETKNWAKILRFKTQPTNSQLAQHNPKLEHKEKGIERG